MSSENNTARKSRKQIIAMATKEGKYREEHKHEVYQHYSLFTRIFRLKLGVIIILHLK